MLHAAAARVAAAAGRSRQLQLQQPVLMRGLAFAAGLAARAAKRAVESFARHQALAYATGEITLADILLAATATFEEVDDVVPPEVPGPGPDIDDERVATAVLGGMVVIAGAFFVGVSIADAVAERRGRTRNKRRCHHPYVYTLSTGQCYGTSSSSSSAPAPRRAVAPFDASRAIAAWLHECEAAGRDQQAAHAPKDIAAASN